MQTFKQFAACILALAMLCACLPASVFAQESMQEGTKIQASDSAERPSLGVNSGTAGSCTWKLDGTVLTISGNAAIPGLFHAYAL